MINQIIELNEHYLFKEIEKHEETETYDKNHFIKNVYLRKHYNDTKTKSETTKYLFI